MIQLSALQGQHRIKYNSLPLPTTGRSLHYCTCTCGWDPHISRETRWLAEHDWRGHWAEQ